MAIFRKIVVLGGDSGNGFLKLTLSGNMLTITVKANVVSNESGDYYLFLIDSDLNMKDYNLGDRGIINKVIQQQNEFNLNDDITAAIVKLSPDYYRRFLIGGNKGNKELFPAIEAYFKSKSVYRVTDQARESLPPEEQKQAKISNTAHLNSVKENAHAVTSEILSKQKVETLQVEETEGENPKHDLPVSEENRTEFLAGGAKERATAQITTKREDVNQKDCSAECEAHTEQNICAKGIPMPKVHETQSRESQPYLCDDPLMREDTTMGDCLKNELIATENYFGGYDIGLSNAACALELNVGDIDLSNKRSLNPKSASGAEKSAATAVETKEDERLISDKLAEKVDLIESLIDGYEQRGGYYAKVEEQLRRIFNLYEREEQLENSIVDSRWAKVNYGSQGDYYAIGVIYDGNTPSYICYGIPATPGQHAPKQLENYCEFVPVGIGGAGYFMLYQNADTGESIRLK